MFATLLATLLLTADPLAADTVFIGGKIWTGDAKQPQAEAIAVNEQGVILKVGSDADVKPLIGPKTKVVSLGGKRVVPGFYDSHLHLLGGGQQLARVELKDAKDEAEFGKRLKEFDEKLPRDRWILGGNWDHDRAFNGKLPTAEIVDKYVKNRPVFIQRYDGHMALANTAALKLAGVTAETKEVPGGVVYRLADGKTPSGVLKDNAMGLVDRIIPEPGEEEVLEAVRAALKAASEVGVTTVEDMDGSSSPTRKHLFRAYTRLIQSNELTCRMSFRWPIAIVRGKTAIDAEAKLIAGHEPFLRRGGVKGFMDGSLGSSTAKMFDPFVGEPNNTGVFVTEPRVMGGLVNAADTAGLSIGIHAIGDRANAELLDLFEAAIQKNGPADRRFRIEHTQHLRPQDYPRFKKLGVIASMQPYHVIDDGRWAEGRIGKERCASSYAYRSLLDAGTILAFGSDWPVAPLDVMAGIDAAVNRRTLDGKHPNGWFPEQRITVEESVRAYTWGSAYAGHFEKQIGTLAPGKLADLVVLERDIFDPAERDRIGTTKVERTVLGGKTVFERKK